jgi:hypothetical protein
VVLPGPEIHPIFYLYYYENCTVRQSQKPKRPIHSSQSINFSPPFGHGSVEYS